MRVASVVDHDNCEICLTDMMNVAIFNCIVCTYICMYVRMYVLCMYVCKCVCRYVSMYEGWNFNSGNYLFTTDTK